jgi:hypothetical protein
LPREGRRTADPSAPLGMKKDRAEVSLRAAAETGSKTLPREPARYDCGPVSEPKVELSIAVTGGARLVWFSTLIKADSNRAFNFSEITQKSGEARSS